jgi:hypothetical protein
MFLKLQKKKSRMTPPKMCDPYGPHLPVGRGFSEGIGGVFCRGFFYQMSASTYLMLCENCFNESPHIFSPLFQKENGKVAGNSKPFIRGSL